MAGPTSSRISSLQNSGHQRRVTHGEVASSVTPQKQTAWRSYSQSSSLGSQIKASPTRTSSSPARPESRKNHNWSHSPFPAPYFRGPSRVNSKSSFSSSTDSKFASATSEFDYNEALHEDTDEEGNRKWKFPEHPNPLRLNSTDVTDQELIDSLRANGQFSAAQRLSVLRAKTEGVDAEASEADANAEIHSPVGKRLGQDIGLIRGDPSNMSIREDIRDAGESAFV